MDNRLFYGNIQESSEDKHVSLNNLHLGFAHLLYETYHT